MILAIKLNADFFFPIISDFYLGLCAKSKSGYHLFIKLVQLVLHRPKSNVKYDNGNQKQVRQMTFFFFF